MKPREEEEGVEVEGAVEVLEVRICNVALCFKGFLVTKNGKFFGIIKHIVRAPMDSLLTP